MNSSQIIDIIIQVIINVMVNPSDHYWMKALKQLILVLVLTQLSKLKVRKRKLLKINVGWLLFKQSSTYMPIKYFIWYVIVAGWQETFRSAASRLAGDFWVCASRLAADLKVSCQPAGRRPRLSYIKLEVCTFATGVTAFRVCYLLPIFV